MRSQRGGCPSEAGCCRNFILPSSCCAWTFLPSFFTTLDFSYLLTSLITEACALAQVLVPERQDCGNLLTDPCIQEISGQPDPSPTPSKVAHGLPLSAPLCHLHPFATAPLVSPFTDLKHR